MKPTHSASGSTPSTDDNPAISEVFTRENVEHELPGTTCHYEQELRGDFEGVEVEGDGESLGTR